MNGPQLLRMVDEMQKLKNIPREVIFQGIETAVQLATERATGEDEEVTVTIDRDTGELVAIKGDDPIDPEMLGRIAAQSAKQLIIQKIREAESDTVFTEFRGQVGEVVVGNVQRVEKGTAIVSLDMKTEAILPRSEQIPGESHQPGDRVKAVVMDVRKNGSRVKIVLSRCHPDFLRCLFEENIPEVEDRTIEIRAVAREAGYRAKVAVSSIDSKVDSVGACVGVRGSRIKHVTDELNGERIDIVRWNDSLQVLIPNALQPAEISEVFVYPRLGRAIVLVEEDQLSLAIGRRGQNVRLASKLVGWDIEIMTYDELTGSLGKAERWFAKMPYLSEEGIQALIEEGFLSYTDLTFVEPEELAEVAELEDVELAREIIEIAEDQQEEMQSEEPEPAPEEPVVEVDESGETEEYADDERPSLTDHEVITELAGRDEPVPSFDEMFEEEEEPPHLHEEHPGEDEALREAARLQAESEEPIEVVATDLVADEPEAEFEEGEAGEEIAAENDADDDSEPEERKEIS